MSNFIYELASPADDEVLRTILKENPMDTPIRLSFEREPSYFEAAKVEGPFHQTIIGRDNTTNDIIGLSTRSVRDLYVNGKVQPMGYLGLLRLRPNYRTGLHVIRGYQFAHELHHDKRCPFYITSIVEGNEPSKRLLASELRGLPRYEEYCLYHTYVIFVKSSLCSVRPPSGVDIIPGEEKHLQSLLKCLHRNGSRYQFYPYWEKSTLFSSEHTPGLSVHDFVLAVRAGEVVGCMVLWDQRPLKQVVVRGFKNGISRRIWLHNVAANFTGYPKSPRKDTSVEHLFLSLVAIDNDERGIFSALLCASYNRAVPADIDFLVLGLAEGHPFESVLKKNYKVITSTSTIYLVSWKEDGVEPLSMVDNRPPGIEVGVL